jgi:outer membrane protein assembly factor BamB
MGHFNAGGNKVYQQLTGALGGGMWATPAYFNNRVYFGPNGGAIEAFSFSSARLGGSPSSVTSTTFGYPGTAPAISANGTSNAILWAHKNGGSATLYAFDANDLSKLLYSSAQNSRDQFGQGNKFITPTIADGKVFVGTTNGVAVFGLLN